MSLEDKYQATALKNPKRGRTIIAGAIFVGIILYLSKFLRPIFHDQDSTLFILGFLPNFGLAFTIPFIYASNRIRLNKPIRHFGISCIFTLLLMILNEIDQGRSGRVFDWYDIFGSLVGVVFAFLIFQLALKVDNIED